MWATGEIPTELTWQILVLIPKGTPGDGSRGIGLLETVWKLMEAIMDTRVKEVVVFHDFLHGFRTNRGTGTAILEVKLAQALACIEQAPLYMVFLDLRKAYDTVDRSRALEVFEQYGMGPRMLRLLRNFWSNQQVIPRQSGYHGPVFTATRGHTQGGLFSPTKFNIVADCVVREWLATAVGDDGHPAAADGFGTTIRDRLNILYADDDVLGSRDAGWLQHGLQVLVDLFRRMGLSANEVKTKAMVCLPGNIRSCLTESAYTRRTTGTGASYRARLQARTVCPECGLDLAVGSVKQHRRSQHGVEPEINWNLLNIAMAEQQGAHYEVNFPRGQASCACPCDGCDVSITTRAGLRSHFSRRHWTDTIHILEEHPQPYCTSTHGVSIVASRFRSRT